MVFFAGGESPGEYGDSFGVLNTLFSGLAFATLVIALLMQQEELSLQRDELDETQEILKLQHSVLKQQSFEQMYFQQVVALNNAIASYETADAASKQVKGLDAFTFVCKVLGEHWIGQRKTANLAHSPGGDEQGLNADMIEKTGRFLRHRITDSSIEAVLENLRASLKTIERANLKLHDCHHYASVLSAQLTSPTLTYFFYYALCYREDEEFARLCANCNFFARTEENKSVFDERNLVAWYSRKDHLIDEEFGSERKPL